MMELDVAICFSLILIWFIVDMIQKRKEKK